MRQWPRVHFVPAENPVSGGVHGREQSQRSAATSACQQRGYFLGA